MTEKQIIERIHAMTDVAEVKKQLEIVNKAYLEITSQVRSQLADVRHRLNSSALFRPEEDLDGELKDLQPATEFQMQLVRYEEELKKQLEKLRK